MENMDYQKIKEKIKEEELQRKMREQKNKKIEVLGIWCYNTVGDNMKIINRKDYINKLIALKNKPDIKIITGVRRAGKSVLLNEFSKYILSVEQDANIIRINFNLLSFDELKDYKKLNSYVRDKYISGVKVHLMAEKWYVELIKELCEEKKIKFEGQSDLYGRAENG